MRNISFALTTDQFRNRTKTVTRRMGWLHAKPGDLLCAVKKGMGLKPGEKIERLGVIRLSDVRREKLRLLIDNLDYGFAETAREGFPEGHPLNFPSEFVEFFCRSHAGCIPGSTVTRLEYEFVDDASAHSARGRD